MHILDSSDLLWSSPWVECVCVCIWRRYKNRVVGKWCSNLSGWSSKYVILRGEKNLFYEKQRHILLLTVMLQSWSTAVLSVLGSNVLLMINEALICSRQHISSLNFSSCLHYWLNFIPAYSRPLAYAKQLHRTSMLPHVVTRNKMINTKTNERLIELGSRWK